MKRKIKNLVDRGYTIQNRIEHWSNELEKIKDELQKLVPLYFHCDEIQGYKAIAFRDLIETINIKDDAVDDLKSILGDQFPDFVEMEIRYKPTQTYLDCMRNGDDPRRTVLRDSAIIEQQIVTVFAHK